MCHKGRDKDTVKFTSGDKSITLPMPDSIGYKDVIIIHGKEIPSEHSLRSLCETLFYYPEREIQLYLEHKSPKSSLILDELRKHGVLCENTEYYYYEKRKNSCVFVKLKIEEAKTQWQKDAIEKGPMFGKTILQLSERKKREYEMQQLMDKMKSDDNNPLELKPNMFGIGVDLLKLFKFVKKKIFR